MTTSSGNDNVSSNSRTSRRDYEPRTKIFNINNANSLETTTEPQTRALFLGQIFPFLGESLKVITGITILVLGILYMQQDKLLYIPEIEGITRNNFENPPGYRNPGEYNIPFETNMIETKDGVAVHSWLLLHPNAKEKKLPTIIFFHGNAG